MSIPEDIRKVERPKNTIVQDSGREGPKRYSVRERSGTRYVQGGNPQPINGHTIGYIINHQFVPICEKTLATGPSMLSYGAAALAQSLSEDILTDLLAVYPPDDAFSILSLACLKVIRPGITAVRMTSAYDSSFVSVFWPGAALSKNSITSLYKNIGADGQKREMFFNLRISRVCKEHHVIIDGTLKQDTGLFNDLSAYSFKARLKGCEDISVLYAFDLEEMEPICAQVFPGNSIDAVSYRSFIRDNNILKGTIIADKGFPPNEIRDILSGTESLHYITPVKRNDKRIAEHAMLQFTDVLGDIDKTVQYKKANTAQGVWLYAFRDSKLAAAEEKTYLERAKKNNDYDDAKYNKKKATFGLLVIESDQDMDPKSIYLAYDSRWVLELVFKAYKSDDFLDRTGVQGDFSIHGCEFINFICSLITNRIINQATKTGLFAETTYRNLIEDLNSAWRKTDAPLDAKPVTDDEYWVHTIPKVSEILERLGLSTPVPKPLPKKRGPKPKKKNSQSQVESSASVKTSESKQDSESKANHGLKGKAQELPNQTAVKRPVGRPRTRSAEDTDHPKRPVGRPRTRPLPDPNQAKRPVGRPRTRPLPDPSAPKRPVGRPRTTTPVKAED